jgi:hypothetical protein
VRAGVRDVTAFTLTRRVVSFAQRIAAPGTIAWTVEARVLQSMRRLGVSSAAAGSGLPPAAVVLGGIAGG